MFELLETRLAPATFIWTGAVDGKWSVAGNWQSSVLPQFDDATLVFNTSNLTGNQVKAMNADILSPTPKLTGIEFGGSGGFSIGGIGFDLKNSATVADNSTGLNSVNVGAIFTNGSQTFTAAAGAHLKFTNANATAFVVGAQINLQGAGQIDIQGIQFRVQSFLVSEVANGLINGKLTEFSNAGPPAGGSRIVVNSGRLNLTAANNFTSDVTVNGGALVVSNNEALGSKKSVIVNNSATVELRNGVTIPEDIALKFTAGGTLRNGDGSDVKVKRSIESGTTTPNPLTLAGPSGGVLVLGRPINAHIAATTAPLNLTGSNFTVSMLNPDFDLPPNGNQIGDVTVGSGVELNLNFEKKFAIPGNLTIDGTVTLVRAAQISFNSKVFVNSGGVFDLNGKGNTIAFLSQTTATGGQVKFGGGSLTVDNAMDDTFAGTLTGNGTLLKRGTGVLTLSGNSPGFVGTNDVAAGKEFVNGTLGGQVIVRGGATLGGKGTVGSIKTNNTSEKLNPGPAGGSVPPTGVLHSLNTTLDGSATFTVLLNTPAAADPIEGGNYDQLDSSGTVNLNNAKLEVLKGAAFGAGGGRTFTIVKAQSISGFFAGLGQGATIDVGGTKFVITYDKTSVVLKEDGTKTTTTLDISYPDKPAPDQYGFNVKFTATVTATVGGAPATSGTVTFANGVGGYVFGTANVVNGQAVFNTSTTPVGSYNSVIAYYSGGGAFEKGESTPAQTLVVDKADTTVEVRPTNPSPTVINYGDHGPVLADIFPHTVGSVLSQTGIVRFFFSGGAGPVDPRDVKVEDNGIEFLDLSLLLPSVNNYSITAQYLGDDNYKMSPVSNAVLVKVNPATTSGVIESIEPNPSNLGQPVTYTMLLTVPAPVGAQFTPTGTVQFFANNNAIGSPVTTFTPVPASNNTRFQVELSGITLPVGTYSIKAHYSGDSHFGMCDTGTVQQEVKSLTGPPVAITTFTTPIHFSDLPQTYIATVTVPMASSPAPTGQMTFIADGLIMLGPSADYTRIGSTNQYTVTIMSMQGLQVGSHDITAHFGGDANYGESVSPAVVQVVIKGDTTTKLEPPESTIHAGEPGSVVATVKAVSPFGGPSGNVVFTITGPGSPPLQTKALSGNTASPDLSSLKVGTYMITAEYKGDDNFNGSTAPETVIVHVIAAPVDEFSFVAVVPNPQEYNTPSVFYNLQLVVSPNGPAPTGTINITADVNGTTILVGTGNAAQFTLTGDGIYTGSIQDTGPVLAPGTYDIAAKYFGDDFYDMATAMTTREVVKTTGPTVTIGPPSVITTAHGPVTYTVTYTDPFLETNSITLSPANITLNATGTATGIVKVGKPAVVNSTTVTVTVAVTNIKGAGTLGISVGPNTATDEFENLAGPAGPSETFNVSGAVRMRIAYVNAPAVLRAASTNVLTLRVVNRGNQADTGVFVTVRVPEFSVFTAAKSTPGWREIAPGVFRINLGTVPAGKPRDLKFAIRTLATAPLNATVSSVASVFDASSADPVASATHFFKIGPRKRWPST